VLSGDGNAEPAFRGHLIDKALRHFAFLGVEFVGDWKDDVTGEDASLHLKLDASLSAPGCLQVGGFRVNTILKWHVSSWKKFLFRALLGSRFREANGRAIEVAS
jgi:hypothetical protein